jgi:O-antigen/teichoic acid export membrane protein
MVMSDLTLHLGGNVIFPALSKVARERPHEIGKILNRIRVRVLVASLPVFIVLSLSATFIIDLIYDDRYTTVGPFLSVLAIAAAVEVFPMIFQNAFIALGNSRMHFFLMSILMMLRIIFMILGYYQAGVLGMLGGIAVGSFLGYLVVATMAHREGWLNLKSELVFIIFLLAGSWISLSLLAK